MPREFHRHVSHKSLEASHYSKDVLALRPILGFWGAKFTKLEILCLERR